MDTIGWRSIFYRSPQGPCCSRRSFLRIAESTDPNRWTTGAALAVLGSLVAVAALGLALGGAASTELGDSALTRAYRIAMLAAAAIAVLSAVTAALTIRPRRAS